MADTPDTHLPHLSSSITTDIDSRNVHATSIRHALWLIILDDIESGRFVGYRGRAVEPSQIGKVDRDRDVTVTGSEQEIGTVGVCLIDGVGDVVAVACTVRARIQGDVVPSRRGQDGEEQQEAGGEQTTKGGFGRHCVNQRSQA